MERIRLKCKFGKRIPNDVLEVGKDVKSDLALKMVARGDAEEFKDEMEADTEKVASLKSQLADAEKEKARLEKENNDLKSQLADAEKESTKKTTATKK